MNAPLISVIGGSGFIGRYIVRQLCQKGYKVRVLCRDTVKAEFLKVSGNVGQVTLQRLDLSKENAIQGALDGSSGVIYLPGLLFQSGRQRFSRIHEKAAIAAASEAARIGAKHFVYVSALGANKARSKYAKTKLAGEAGVKAAFPNASILRPSLVIGPEDGFFQRFARMNAVAPALPLIAGGKTKFQPVYVDDVARAVIAVLTQPSAQGNSYELTGPATYSFRELLELMGRVTNSKVRFAVLPKPFAMLAGLACELAPFSPQITRDQVRNLAVDNIADGTVDGLHTLGISPTNIETVLPTLLKRFIKKA